MNPPSGISRNDALALAALGRDLLDTRTAASLARRLCDAVRSIVHADGATFVLREDDEVFYAEEDAVGALWKGRRFPATACISGWAALNRATAVIEDIYSDERIPVEAYRPTFVKSLAMTPMVDGETVCGALGAYWSVSHRATEREVWLLEQLATMAAFALTRVVEAELADASRERTATDGATDVGAYASRLLAVVAHDLRNPLSAIHTAAALLLEDADRESDLAELGRSILRNASRATGLVERVLDGARGTEGRLSLRLEQTRLDDLCRSVVQELGVDGRVRLEYEELVLSCDAAMLRQALANLLSNAVQHGAADRPVTLRLHRDGDAGLIHVHNHGTPIPVEAHDSLFDAFRRFSDSGRDGSIGLGLYITEQIVRAHGGTVTVRSSHEEGTSFCVSLPLGVTMVPRLSVSG